MSFGSSAQAEVTIDEEDGRPCVIVECVESGDTATAWGTNQRSVKRALAMLSEDCDCGARWHECDDLDEFDDD